MCRQANDDAPAADNNLCRHFDQQASPRAWLGLNQTIAATTTLIVPMSFLVRQRLRRHRWYWLRLRWQRHRLTKTHQQVERGRMQIQTKEIGQEAVVAGAV